MHSRMSLETKKKIIICFILLLFILPAIEVQKYTLKSSILLSGILGFFKFSYEHGSTSITTEGTQTTNEYRWSYVVCAKTGGLQDEQNI